ncbi:hypothetical protein [Paraburkholderia sp. 40]|uniref:hypothetical protein n=1 Tax=Paraburkholderia sp. 40 TaxID=2991059 RepID=UPI003D23776A
MAQHTFRLARAAHGTAESHARVAGRIRVVIARSADRFLGALPTLIEDARLPDPVRAMLLEVREQLSAVNLRLASCD